MLKHVVPAHRSSSSLNNSSLSTPTTSFCYFPPRRSSLTAVESASPSPCDRCIYRRAASCGGTTSPPLSRQKSPIYEGQRGKCDLIQEETPSPCKFPQIEENNNLVDNPFLPNGLHETPSRRCPSRSSGFDSARSFVDMVNRHDSVPRSIHEFDLEYQVNSCQVPDSQERECRCHGSNSCSYPEDETASLVTIDEAFCPERSQPFRTPTSDSHSYGSPSPFPYNPSLLSKSCTLPRREIMMHNEEIRRSSFRSNASTCSLLSSVSCSSLSSVKNFDSRSTSTSSLLEAVPVKIYLRRLRSDMEYKTVSLSLQTTCKELVVILLTKFRLRHRDPNLFFVLMEVTVRSPSDGAPVKRQLVLEDNARPAELQQCRPKGEANFSIGVRRGGLIRVHDSILMQGSQYKSLMVAYHTTAEELVQLVLKCYNSSENPLNYALHEVCKNPYSDRPLTPDECPLKTQWEWPRNQRNNWAFFLRRNLTYAFSLKSRMMSRNVQSPSRTELHGFEEESLRTSSRHSSSPDSRSSSVSSSSSVSRICNSSSPDSRSSVSSTTSVSSGTSVSEKSLDSGFGSPFSSVRASEQTKKSLQITSTDSTETPTTSPTKEKLQPSGKIPLKDLPPKPKLDSLQKNFFSSFQNSPEKKVVHKPVVVISKPLDSNTKLESLAPTSSPVKSLPTVPNSKPSESLQNTPKSVIPITASVSRLSLNSSLPSVTGTPIPASTSTPTSRALPPKPRQRTIITITSTTRSPTKGQMELQHRHLRPVIPPPSLKIKSNIVRHPPESTSNDQSSKDTPKSNEASTTAPSSCK
ncbi:hypothetical protein Anas_12640 [Armadillidium nasatum]|uniref:Ras-associating domain-containing protein n=1 Tax=Armadillidium nasatum TaxID=96803 RepID=A0A5N5TJQ5_9CRUS|nr:hypothetical protein Anas_12640 [Armadillidium nasatum]